MIVNGIRGHKLNSVLVVDKTSWYSRRTSLKSSMVDGDQPGPWSSKEMSPKGVVADGPKGAEDSLVDRRGGVQGGRGTAYSVVGGDLLKLGLRWPQELGAARSGGRLRGRVGKGRNRHWHQWRRGIPRRSPSSSSVEIDKGIIWCPLETKIAASERRSCRAIMLTKNFPVNAGGPDWRTRLASTRVGVVESKIVRVRRIGGGKRRRWHGRRG